MTSPLKGFMHGIMPTRVSLVKRPANRRQFLVTKSNEETEMDFAEIIQIIQKTEADNEEALIEVLRSADKDEPTIQAAVSIYRTMSAFADSLTADDLAAIGKSLEVTPVDEVVEEVVEKEEEVEEVVEKADEVAEEEVAEEVVEEVEKAEDTEEVVETEVTEVEEVVKSEEDDRITELQSEIASLKEDKRRRELLKMVEGLRVGKTEDELTEILLSVDAAGGDVEPLVETWKTASKAVEAALTEIGSDMPGIVSGDVFKQAEAEVDRIAKDEGVSITKAWDLLGDRNPALLKKYYEE